MICSHLDNMQILLDRTLLGSSNQLILHKPDSIFYFIPITKNASSFTYDCFSQIGWNYYKLDSLDEVINKIPIVILRDPVDRWCSGFAQDYSSNQLNYDLQNNNVIDNLFFKGFFGSHTYTQHWFLHKFNLLNAIFIKFTESYLDIVNIFKDNIDDINQIKYDNIIGTSNKSHQIEIKLKQQYELKESNRENLKRYLWHDLELFKKANFIDETKTLQNYKLWDSFKKEKL